jgi:hypothetical protein
MAPPAFGSELVALEDEMRVGVEEPWQDGAPGESDIRLGPAGGQALPWRGVIAITDVEDSLRVVEEVCPPQGRRARAVDQRPDRDPDGLASARGEVAHDLREPRAFTHRPRRSP